MIHLFDFIFNENKQILHRLFYHDGFLYVHIDYYEQTSQNLRTQIENIFKLKYNWTVFEGFTIPTTNQLNITYFGTRLNFPKRLKSHVYNRLKLIHDL